MSDIDKEYDRYLSMPPLSVVHELFRYDPETGNLYNKKSRMGAAAGKIAGTREADGYRSVSVNMRRYRVHRIIYMMIHGVDPGRREIDHINGDPSDNRPANLRLATHSQNRRNVGALANNKTGLRGVNWHKTRGKYRACISINGTQKHIGHFDCPLEAARAYDQAAISHYGEFANVNFSAETSNG